MEKFKFRAKVMTGHLHGFHGMSDSRFAGVESYETIIDVNGIFWSKGEIDYVTDSDGNEYSVHDGSLLDIELVNQ